VPKRDGDAKMPSLKVVRSKGDPLKALITGSGGLIGSACVNVLASRGWEVIGIDNDMRREFFGLAGSTSPVIADLRSQVRCYQHVHADIRDRQHMREILKQERPDFIIHAAGQPSHDRAAAIPYENFDVNAVGTLNLLVAVRDFCPESPFCFTSTNKVYGDRPNSLPLVESATRYDYADGLLAIDESMSIDSCLHSLFGASKVAADVLAQEFGRYFNMPVGIFRCGCVTGPQHAAVELHGYLAYIASCALSGREYTIFGYKGKQVRDQIHCDDVAELFLEFFAQPHHGEVYNLGGGRENSISILETISCLDELGHKLKFRLLDENRLGDHICYISDLSKIRSHFPNWKVKYGVQQNIEEIIRRQSDQMRPAMQSFTI
jgi:CDP-paratose 2-epimerase